MYKEITQCRICGNKRLRTVLDLGNQKLTGVFPMPDDQGKVDEAPLVLVKCDGDKCCGLVQLKHSCDTSQMYGMNYGYRSGLNKSMVEHLKEITSYIKEKVDIEKNDIVLDIGSNDGTLLGTYGFAVENAVVRIGMDPTAAKFGKYYDSGIVVVEDFFSQHNFDKVSNGSKAKVITSIAMFYDLENPVDFARQIAECLASDGVWVFEQSYMPYMIQTRSFDTVCQEHLEYYGMKQIDWILKEVGMKIIDVEFNNVNGGSFRVAAAKEDSSYPVSFKVEQTLISEEVNGYNNSEIFDIFAEGIEQCRKECMEFLKRCRSEGKTVLGYGASTKGNVLLQYFDISADLLPYIAEVNSDKYGRVTPGTGIPIISEDEARQMKPDYFFVLPWHFKHNILEKEKEYMTNSGCKFVFPLPTFSIEPFEVTR